MYRNMVISVQVDARGEGTVETPGVQRTNIITAADKEVIAREGHAETTVAHDVTATSRADETKLTSDQEDDQTTAAIDDMFGLDLVHRRKPPSRVRFELKHPFFIYYYYYALDKLPVLRTTSKPIQK